MQQFQSEFLDLIEIHSYYNGTTLIIWVDVMFLYF
jgi:hypothetical protein